MCRFRRACVCVLWARASARSEQKAHARGIYKRYAPEFWACDPGGLRRASKSKAKRWNDVVCACRWGFGGLVFRLMQDAACVSSLVYMYIDILISYQTRPSGLLVYSRVFLRYLRALHHAVLPFFSRLFFLYFVNVTRFVNAMRMMKRKKNSHSWEYTCDW